MDMNPDQVLDGMAAPKRSVAILMLGVPLPPPYGGIAKYMQAAVPALLERGYTLHVGHLGTVQLDDRLSRKVASGQLHFYAYKRPSWSELLRFLGRDGLSFLPILIRYFRAVLGSPRMAMDNLKSVLIWSVLAARVCRRVRVHIVHAYDYPWSQGAAAVWCARRFGAKSVVTTFGEVMPHRSEMEHVDRFSGGYRTISRFALLNSDRAASMTGHCRAIVRQIGVDPVRMRLVRFVVGMKPFRDATLNPKLRDECLGASGTSLMLFVGQIRERKGPQVLIQSLPRVLEAHPGARLVLVGPDHGYGDTLRQLAGELGVAHAVHMVGAVRDEVLPNYYAACDLFLFPTLTRIECLGLSFVQAMFAGKPVIATEIAGAPEVIRDGVDGYLVPPGDSGRVAERIIDMLNESPARRRSLGQAARERAAALFDESDVMSDLFSLYEDLLASTPEASAQSNSAAPE